MLPTMPARSPSRPTRTRSVSARTAVKALTGITVRTSPQSSADADGAASGCTEHPDITTEIAACAADFRHFLPHWRFVNRETGEVQTFANLWDGQQAAADAMATHPWIIFLKAGKLGFTELECAFDGWVARFRRNAQVNLFSMGAKEAVGLLEYVRFGIDHLPPYMRLPVLEGEAGGDTTMQFRLRGPGPDDTRTVTAYASKKNTAIDKTGTHSHVDELARMLWPQDTWSSIESTVPPGGSVHIVSRGAGAANALATIWRTAEGGESPLFPFFARWDTRPRTPVRCPACHTPYHGLAPTDACPGITQVDANAAWYGERSTMPTKELYFLAPRTPEEALTGDDDSAFVEMEWWDGCYDPDLSPLLPGDRTPIVLSLDAGVTSDFFAAAMVSRHPTRHDAPALRGYKVWRPPKGGQVDFSDVEAWVRVLCLGGCINLHPNMRSGPSAGMMCAAHPERRYQHRVSTSGNATCQSDGIACPACAGDQRVPAMNVVMICYDRFQMSDMAQSLTRDRVAWCYEFDQNALRLEADGALRMHIIQRNLSHRIDPSDIDNEMRQAVANSAAQINPKEDTRLRIVKRTPQGKIDLCVALSMAVNRCLYLTMGNAAA